MQAHLTTSNYLLYLNCIGQEGTSMRDGWKWLVLLCAGWFFTGHASAELLTPPNEPQDNVFYVCYTKRVIEYSIRPQLSAEVSQTLSRLVYHKYKYKGCIISRTSCCDLALKVRKSHQQSCKMKPFGLFNNYPQSLNAFYRCAYS